MTTLPASPQPRPIANGMGARVEIVGSQIRIKRDGLFGLMMTLFGMGDGLAEKTIPIQRLSAIEVVRTFAFGIFCVEYMRFSYPGSPESKGSDWRDAMLEHTVMMNLFDNRDFYALKEHIEREMESIRRGNGGAAPPTEPVPGVAPVAPRPTWGDRVRAWAGMLAEPLASRVPGGERGLMALAVAVAALVGSVVWVVQQPRPVPMAEAGGRGGAATDLLPLFGLDSRRAISWEGPGGVLYRAAVRGRAYENFLADARARAASVRGRAEARFQERLAENLRPVFADVDERIPDYGEWVFNWWTSYILLVRGIGAIWDQVASGTEQSLEDVTQRIMADEIKARYVQIVLPPEEFRPALREAVAGAVAAARAELRQACDELRLRFAAFLIENAAAVEFQTAANAWAPDRGWESRAAENRVCPAAGRHLDAAAGDLEAGYDDAFGTTGAIDDVAIRITRPFVTTIVSAGLSASSVAALAVSLGIPAALVATPAMAAVLTKSAFTLVDLMLSQLDETLNRQNFEAAVREAVARSRTTFEQAAARTAREAVARELDDFGLAMRRVSLRPADGGLLVPAAVRP
jgi:hypothetical protein